MNGSIIIAQGQVPGELPDARADRIMTMVKNAQKQTFSRGELVSILNYIAACSVPDAEDLGCRAPITVKSIRRGDVFIHKLIGGKVRPWVTLRVDEDHVIALALSHMDHGVGSIPAESPYWAKNWIGMTAAKIKLEDACREVTRPYANAAHLNFVERKVVEALRLGEKRPVVQSIAQIRGRINAKEPWL